MTDNREFLRKLFAHPDEQPPAAGTAKPAAEQGTESTSEFLRNLFHND